MTTNNKKPAIRFNGFEEDWEEKKLGELGTITTGNTPSTAISDYYSDDGLMWVTPTDISENIIYDTTKKLSPLGQQVARVVPKNTLLITCIASIGKNTMLGNMGSFNQQINGLTPNEKTYEPYFLLSESRLWSAQMKRSAAAGTMQIVNRTEFSELKTWLPKYEEQTQIGTYFRTLDSLITLQQKKCEQLANVKKSMLQKMFPQNGSTVPELRFAGFTGDWEQRKASEIADYSKGNGYSKSDLVDCGTPIILYGRLYTKYQSIIEEVDTFVKEKKGAVLSTGNEVVIPASGETAEDIARASAVVKSGIILGGDLNILKSFSFINSIFLVLLISHGNAQKELAKKAQGKSVVHVHNSDIQELDIQYPSIEEQTKIGTYFRNLDKLISLQRRKLDKLNNIKKSMLQKMFV